MATDRQIRLSPLAGHDLEDIWLYTLKTWSRKQADSYIADIMAVFTGLATGTKVGRNVNVRQGYLKYAVGTHMIYFRHVPESVDIMRILHQRMDVERHI